jgi:hypothetical protein
MVGRNDPCPCGSGKKCKQCCLPNEQVVSLAGARYDRAYRALLKDLESFCIALSEEELERAESHVFPPDPDAEARDEDGYAALLDWRRASVS